MKEDKNYKIRAVKYWLKENWFRMCLLVVLVFGVVAIFDLSDSVHFMGKIFEGEPDGRQLLDFGF